MLKPVFTAVSVESAPTQIDEVSYGTAEHGGPLLGRETDCSVENKKSFLSGGAANNWLKAKMRATTFLKAQPTQEKWFR